MMGDIFKVTVLEISTSMTVKVLALVLQSVSGDPVIYFEIIHVNNRPGVGICPAVCSR